MVERRCSLCGSKLATVNTTDQCFRHQVRPTDEEVIGPPIATQGQLHEQKKQIIGKCEGCGELKVIAALGRCWRCYQRKRRGRPDVFAAKDEAVAMAFRTDLKPADTIVAAGAVFGVTREELLGSERTRLFVQARHVAMYLLRTDLGMSLPEIGERLNRDHTTVLHACRKVEEKLKREPTLWALVDKIRSSYLRP